MYNNRYFNTINTPNYTFISLHYKLRIFCIISFSSYCMTKWNGPIAMLTTNKKYFFIFHTIQKISQL